MTRDAIIYREVAHRLNQMGYGDAAGAVWRWAESLADGADRTDLAHFRAVSVAGLGTLSGPRWQDSPPWVTGPVDLPPIKAPD